MMDTHHDNPVVVVLLSAGAGLFTWLQDQHVTKALLVAMACGFVGGLGKATGLWVWNKVRERRISRKG
ncbi:MAG TPA: hypothetical protein PKD45_14440 [Flavobacteriales bacterium]|nr:hypothetical protein [Flavobacteriales bacterium]